MSKVGLLDQRMYDLTLWILWCLVSFVVFTLVIIAFHITNLEQPVALAGCALGCGSFLFCHVFVVRPSDYDLLQKKQLFSTCLRRVKGRQNINFNRHHPNHRQACHSTGAQLKKLMR